jgi:DNA-binding Xre family transcriptional regulator
MNNVRDNERDRVLMAFHQACEKRDLDQILEWTKRFPKYADDIRAHAAVARDYEAHGAEEAEPLSESVLNVAYSNALNAIYAARQKDAQPAAAASFHDIAAARQVDVIEMARAMDIARGVLADLFDGAMLRPIRKRLIDAVCQALAITVDTFDRALDLALQNPRLGHAKASGAPTLKRRTCDEIIANSRMPPARVRFWLEGD